MIDQVRCTRRVAVSSAWHRRAVRCGGWGWVGHLRYDGHRVGKAQSWSIHRTCPHDTRSPPVDSPGNSPDMLSQGRHSELLQSKGSSFPVHRLPHEHAPTRHSSSPDGVRQPPEATHCFSDLADNQLSSLPAGVFDELTNLQRL